MILKEVLHLAKNYNIKEVSVEFDVHYQTVRNWIKSGYLRATKYKGVVQISQEEVNRIKKVGEAIG